MIRDGRVRVHQILVLAPDRADRGTRLCIVTEAAGKLRLQLFQNSGETV